MSRSRIMYAHIPGGGPAGKACRACHHFADFERGSTGGCLKAAEMAGLGLSEVHPIYGSTRACKYFEEAPPCTSPA